MASASGGQSEEEYVGKHRTNARTPQEQPAPKFLGGAKAGKKGKGAGGQQADGKNPQAGKWTFSGGTFNGKQTNPSSTTGIKKKKK